MKDSHVQALIAAYYLSRFDRQAYERLGFQTQKATHEHIGRHLDVKPSTVKNMRDEFDAVHPNDRAGWYQRDLRPSRRRIIEMLGELSETELYAIVTDILAERDFRPSDSLQHIAKQVRSNDRSSTSDSSPAAERLQTGHRAEMLFIEHHAMTDEPVAGGLRDTRNEACGYDFEIEHDNGVTCVEVKGVSGESGSILFTEKEWRVALWWGCKIKCVSGHSREMC